MKPEMTPLNLDEVLHWDVDNWRGCLEFWEPWLRGFDCKSTRVLVIGDNRGGLSLWFAWKGFQVICTDYEMPDARAAALLRQWNLSNHVTFAQADIFALEFPTASIDIVACKSVVGGLKKEHRRASTRTLENQKMAVNEVWRVLRPGGVFLGAENMTGTRLHQLIRWIRHRGYLGWRYLSLQEMTWLFDKYGSFEQKAYGILGAYGPNWRWMRKLLLGFNRSLSHLLPKSWCYISYIRARK
jgi:SAM-dependent methyltransferase